MKTLLEPSNTLRKIPREAVFFFLKRKHNVVIYLLFEINRVEGAMRTEENDSVKLSAYGAMVTGFRTFS